MKKKLSQLKFNLYFYNFFICFFLSNLVPEDNFERLRNIRDMFENSNQQEADDLQLQKVEKLEPSEKLKEVFRRFVKFENKKK